MNSHINKIIDDISNIASTADAENFDSEKLHSAMLELSGAIKKISKKNEDNLKDAIKLKPSKIEK